MKERGFRKCSKFNVSGNDYRSEKEIINELLGAAIGGIAGSKIRWQFNSSRNWYG